jgi:hypothetical protein
MTSNFFTFSRFTLFVALCISAIAAYYSVQGLTAIFAGAVIPIIVMGGILEIAKITTTVWLHKYWDRASVAIRIYLTSAVIMLAALTSMGIFGLLSKAHTDQSVVSGDVSGQVALFDEKIKTQRDNIETARRALAQMDEQVNQRLSRGDSEAGAERAVQIRRQQARERTQLQQEIAVAQREITKLNEQRAPLASQLRKVEAEVGPIKYIAALIYGDNPDVALLERAVRWVIIMIVLVFDPLAIILILAANNSLKWERERNPLVSEAEHIVQEPETSKKEPEPEKVEPLPEVSDHPEVDPIRGETTEWQEKIKKIEGSTPWPDKWDETVDEVEDIVEKPLEIQDTRVEIIEVPEIAEVTEIVEVSAIDAPTVEPVTLTSNIEPATIDLSYPDVVKSENEGTYFVKTTGVTQVAELYHPSEGYGTLDGKKISIDALRSMRPDMVMSAADPVNQILFGTTFPIKSRVADIHIRTDVLPHNVYKFNGSQWFSVDKTTNTSYLQNINYVQYLISKLDSGEYDPEWLTSAEQDEISDYLKRNT